MPELTWDQWHSVVRAMAREKSEWAGIPSPLKGLRLRVEEKYPFKQIETLGGEPTVEDPEDKKWSFVNSWYSRRLHCTIQVMRSNETGKSHSFFLPWHAADMLLGTMMAMYAWQPQAERRALDKLAEMIPNHLFLTYMMTGTFVERSKRSGISYIFRKLRPTIALKESGDTMKVLCTLCLHPIAFYEGTWAGAMVPTDDVIAHLVLMRGDEKLFWRRANQHPCWMPQSGL